MPRSTCRDPRRRTAPPQRLRRRSSGCAIAALGVGRSCIADGKGRYLVAVPSADFEPLVLDVKDGTKVHIRPIKPEDEPLLHEAVAAMSERTVYFRFFSPLKRMPDALAHRLAVVDYNDRFALVATTNKPGGKERIVGVARYDRVAGTDVAEVAVAVIDEYQRRGLGSALMTILGKVAGEHGLKTFTLIVLPENQQMLGLLRKMGWIHQAKLMGGVYEITFDLPAES